MLGDKLPEEEEYDYEKAYEERMVNLANLFSEVTEKLKIKEKSFYVIGINPKKKIFTCKQVETKSDAYSLIKHKGLTIYVFANDVFDNWNCIVEE